METTQAVDDTQTSDLSDLEPIPNAGDLADHDLSARFVQPELVRSSAFGVEQVLWAVIAPAPTGYGLLAHALSTG